MKLALGTAQFGLDYGISNFLGRVPKSEVEAILDLATQNNINTLDTASQYGMSERVLGESIKQDNYFHIITKTPSFVKVENLGKEQAEILKQTFVQSLQCLNQPNCYGLLMHQANDLLREGSEYLIEAMQDLKSAGLVDKIGVSIYSAEQIDALLQRYSCIDIIQLPLNILDQRLLKGNYLQKIKQRSIEIHARSVFLQGLLLMSISKLNTFFKPIIPHLTHYFKMITEQGLSPLQAAILFMKQIQDVDKILVGVTSVAELNEIIQAYNDVTGKKVDFSFAAIDDEQFINPVQWRFV